MIWPRATADGKKELIVVQDGYRESDQSWTAMLLNLKQRGMTISGVIRSWRSRMRRFRGGVLLGHGEKAVVAVAARCGESNTPESEYKGSC